MFVVVGYGLCHLAIPKDVVGKDEGATLDIATIHQHTVIVGVLSLVAIHEDHVVALAKAWHNLESRAYMLANALTILRLREEFCSYLLKLVINLYGVEVCTLVEATSDAQRRVASEGTYVSLTHE